MQLRVVVSTSAAVRVGAAAGFLAGRGASEQALVVGASRGAADDLARLLTRRGGATIGLTRFSLTELAARAALSRLATRQPGGDAGGEAAAARVVFDAVAAGELSYFGPVASSPGFARALARTLHELRMAGISSDRLSADGPSAVTDLGALLARAEAQLSELGVADRAGLFRLAADACRARQAPWLGLKTVLLDVPLDSRAERDFVVALLARAPSAIATIPDGDAGARDALAPLAEHVDDAAEPVDHTDVSHLRRYVFASDPPPRRQRAGDVVLLSAPGEGREAVEIVRRVLDEAARGVPFDEMAVLLRAPHHYLGLLEHACARGGVPAYFDRGTRRPDPAGRAFVALLSTAVEGLSARSFDEYLSLGQVPATAPSSRPGQPDAASRLTDEQFGPLSRASPDASDGGDADIAADAKEAPDRDESAVVAGTLRSPWKWEELIVESAVIGGRTRALGKERWRRRLNGLEAEYRLQIAELRREEPESPRIRRYERDLLNLGHLRAFALPVIDEMADWPERASWRDWLDRFSALAPRVLRRPARVLGVLAALRPLASIDGVRLEEARDVLRDRLVALDWDPPAHRYGRLFLGTSHQARGRTFRVVFVPGLAERIVPQRPREDPLLLDEVRRGIDRELVDQDQRGRAERLLLKIAIGAARDRLYLSYPRLDVAAEMRARVPSFYALDVIRAITGTVPDYRALEAEAAGEAGASLAWPAPADPDRAIDDLEHDLASLRPLLESRDHAAVRGRAHYLLDLNDALRRSVTSRWTRWRAKWSDSDGLVRPTPGIAAALEANRLTRRRYSLSALQRFSVCPYQFLLATIHRLEPRADPEPIVRLDPLTRGSLFHAVQAQLSRTLKDEGRLPVTPVTLPAALETLELALARVAAAYEEALAPAIERVWRDEIDGLGRDLVIWLQRLADDPAWVGEYFEFSFGLDDEGRDPRSLKDPILVDGRFLLHGSVDLVERHAERGALRVTDHKTGRNRTTQHLIVDGGRVLQPVLYSAAVAEGLQLPVEQGRLYYCTTAGGFTERQIPIDAYARSQGLEVLTTVDRAVARAFLPAAPSDRACTWCDFKTICGPREQERVARKAKDGLADLLALRAMR